MSLSSAIVSKILSGDHREAQRLLGQLTTTLSYHEVVLAGARKLSVTFSAPEASPDAIKAAARALPSGDELHMRVADLIRRSDVPDGETLVRALEAEREAKPR